MWGDQQQAAPDIPARHPAAWFPPAVILVPLILGLMSHLRVITPTVIAVFSSLTVNLFLITEPLCYGPMDLETLPQIQPWGKF